MTEDRLRRIIADELRKALDRDGATSSVDGAETGAIGAGVATCVKDTKEHTDHINTEVNGGSLSSGLTELDVLRRVH